MWQQGPGKPVGTPRNGASRFPTSPVGRHGARPHNPAFCRRFRVDGVLLVKAAIMGIVEGLTEFLPISSTGHLILAGHLLGLSGERDKVFEIAIQTGAILAVILVYWQKIRETVVHLPSERSAQRFALNVLVAFIPAVVLGLALGKAIKSHLFTPGVVATTFILGGFVILWAEGRHHPKVRVQEVEDMRWTDALKLGLVQCLALIPGTSRSGATIIGGMLLGLVAQGRDRLLLLPRDPDADRRRRVQPLQGARRAQCRRRADVPGGPAVLVRERLAVRPLAAALHLQPQLHALRLVPARLRRDRAAHFLDRLDPVGRDLSPRRRA
jgi:undecaprenyl-diphosphatase UppP